MRIIALFEGIKRKILSLLNDPIHNYMPREHLNKVRHLKIFINLEENKLSKPKLDCLPNIKSKHAETQVNPLQPETFFPSNFEI